MKFLSVFSSKNDSLSEEEHQQRVGELSRKKEDLLRDLDEVRVRMQDEIRRTQLEKEFFFKKSLAEMRPIDQQAQYVLKSFENKKYDKVFLEQNYEPSELPKIYAQQIPKLLRYTKAFSLGTERFEKVGRMIVKDEGLSANQHLEHLEAALQLKESAWQAIQLFREEKNIQKMDEQLKEMEEEFQTRYDDLKRFKSKF